MVTLKMNANILNVVQKGISRERFKMTDRKPKNHKRILVEEAKKTKIFA